MIMIPSADDDDDNSNILIFQRLILALSVAALGESISILMVSNSNRCSVCCVVLLVRNMSKFFPILVQFYCV